MNRLTKDNVVDIVDVDLTPMLDVVFIMLIFFVATAVFVHESGLSLTVPPQTDSPGTSQSIVFTISSDNEIRLDKRIIDPRAIRSNIERLFAENPEATVVISANPQAKASTYVGIADAAYQANLSSVVLIIQ